MKKTLASLAVITLLVFSCGSVAFAYNSKPSTSLKIELAKGKKDNAKQNMEVKNQLKSEQAEKNAQKETKRQEKAEHKEIKAAGKDIKNQIKAELKARKLEERIKVKGKNLKFDVPPVIKEGRTLIPVRAVTEGLGAKVTYDYETKQITITKGDVTVIMTLGSKTIEVNGESMELDVPANSINNRTFVPLRFLAEVFGVKVEYDEETGDIEIGDPEEDDDNDLTDDKNELDGTDEVDNKNSSTESKDGTIADYDKE